MVFVTQVYAHENKLYIEIDYEKFDKKRKSFSILKGSNVSWAKQYYKKFSGI